MPNEHTTWPLTGWLAKIVYSSHCCSLGIRHLLLRCASHTSRRAMYSVPQYINHFLAFCVFSPEPWMLWMCIIYQNDHQSLPNKLIMVICHHMTVTWHVMAVSSAVSRDIRLRIREIRYDHAASTSLPWVVTLNPHNSSQQATVTEGRCGFERLKG